MGKLRKTRKGVATSRKKGGATPNTIHFKYTKELRRAQWVDTIYPYGGVITSVLPKIRWDSFRYEGPLFIETDGLEDENWSSPAAGTGTKFKMTPTEKPTKLYETVGHSVPVSGAPYEVFGGAACELWGKKIPDVPIHKFVDITGDIDVSVSQPTVVPEKAILRELIDNAGDDAIRPLMLYQDTYTQYGDAFSRWLFQEVVEQFSAVAKQFNIKELGLPGRDENSETTLGDLHAVTGNLLITRLISENKSMIKIQISTKVLPDTVNHIMEFILSPHGNFRSNTKFTVDGIYVQGPIKLLLDQVEGLAGRADGIKNTMVERGVAQIQNYPGFYKFDNHCARLLYLVSLIKFVEGKPYPENRNNFMYMTESYAIFILEKLYKRGRGALCDAHFGAGFIDRLIPILESMKYIGVGQLTTKIHPELKKKLNKARAA